MLASSQLRGLFDPFGLFAPVNERATFLGAAREIADIDAEMMETLLDCGGTVIEGAPDQTEQLRYLSRLMRSLQLNPESVRLEYPEIMHELEANCLACVARERCLQACAVGRASELYHDFCPGATRLHKLIVDNM